MHPGMVVYEVQLDIDASIASGYLDWLDGHVREILALPGFLGATLYAIDEPPPAEGRLGLCVQYRLRDRAALEDYLRDHAPRLRADGIARFGGRFVAQRRVMSVKYER